MKGSRTLFGAYETSRPSRCIYPLTTGSDAPTSREQRRGIGSLAGNLAVASFRDDDAFALPSPEFHRADSPFVVSPVLTGAPSADDYIRKLPPQQKHPPSSRHPQKKSGEGPMKALSALLAWWNVPLCLPLQQSRRRKGQQAQRTEAGAAASAAGRTAAGGAVARHHDILCSAGAVVV